MQFLDLPSDVLAIVLSKSLPSSRNVSESFKAKLPLLSVCSRLRQLALPLVYNLMYLQYGTQVVPHWGGETEDVEVVTNLDLVVAAGYTNVVRQVKAEVYYLVNPFPRFRAAIEIMSVMVGEWRGVRELELIMNPGVGPLDELNINMSDHGDDVSEVGGALAALFPGVCKLNLHSTRLNRAARALYSCLAGFYTDQLQVLESRHPITVSHDRPFRQLKEVTLMGDNDHSYKLPRMNPSSLEWLDLDKFQASHSWAPFSDDSGSQVIEFTRLRNLDVTYGQNRRDSSVAESHLAAQPWVLQFPALEDLTLRCLDDTCPLLDYAVLPEMDTLSITASQALYRHIASMTLPVVWRLVLRIPHHPNNNSENLADISHIIEKASKSTKLELVILDDSLQVLPSSLTCFSLTRLEVSAPISVDNMLKIINRLPNLEDLSFDNFTLDEIQTDISIPKGEKHNPVPPLKTKIRRLCLGFDDSGNTDQLVGTVDRYLLLKIPTLVDFIGSMIPRQSHLDFISEYSQWYPHLESIRVNCY